MWTPKSSRTPPPDSERLNADVRRVRPAAARGLLQIDRADRAEQFLLEQGLGEGRDRKPPEVVADRDQSVAFVGRGSDLVTFVGRRRERLLDQAVDARPEKLRGDRGV